MSDLLVAAMTLILVGAVGKFLILTSQVASKPEILKSLLRVLLYAIAGATVLAVLGERHWNLQGLLLGLVAGAILYEVTTDTLEALAHRLPMVIGVMLIMLGALLCFLSSSAVPMLWQYSHLFSTGFAVGLGAIVGLILLVWGLRIGIKNRGNKQSQS